MGKPTPSSTEPEVAQVGQNPPPPDPKAFIEKDVQQRPLGPLLQCNVMENLKLTQGKDGGRENLGAGPVVCRGDQSVVLRKFTGGNGSATTTIGAVTRDIDP